MSWTSIWTLDYTGPVIITMLYPLGCSLANRVPQQKILAKADMTIHVIVNQW